MRVLIDMQGNDAFGLHGTPKKRTVRNRNEEGKIQQMPETVNKAIGSIVLLDRVWKAIHTTRHRSCS